MTTSSVRGRVVPLLALVVLLVVVGCQRSDPAADAEVEAVFEEPIASTGEEQPAAAEDPEATQAEGQAPEQAPLRRTAVRLYFPARQGNGLVAERREIFDTASPGDRIKQIVNDLIAGPVSSRAHRAVPRQARLRQAYVLDGGVAYLDFSSGLVRGMRGGSMQEMLTVYAIVDSVVLNVGEVRRVGILVEGEPVDTLNGHMDLRRPLAANRGLILRAALAAPSTPSA